MANPSANQNRPPRPGAYRYFACASWVWLVPRAREVAAARTAGPVSPGFSLDTESPAGQNWKRLVSTYWSLQVTAVVTNNARGPNAHLKMANILDDVWHDGPVLSTAFPTLSSRIHQGVGIFASRAFRLHSSDGKSSPTWRESEQLFISKMLNIGCAPNRAKFSQVGCWARGMVS